MSPRTGCKNSIHGIMPHLERPFLTPARKSIPLINYLHVSLVMPGNSCEQINQINCGERETGERGLALCVLYGGEEN